MGNKKEDKVDTMTNKKGGKKGDKGYKRKQEGRHPSYPRELFMTFHDSICRREAPIHPIHRSPSHLHPELTKNRRKISDGPSNGPTVTFDPPFSKQRFRP